MEKSIREPKAKFVCMRVREKKTQQLLRYIKNVTRPFKKDFKFAELLTKTSFCFTLETVLKMAKETTKETSRSVCAKVTKSASKMVAKTEVNLN